MPTATHDGRAGTRHRLERPGVGGDGPVHPGGAPVGAGEDDADRRIRLSAPTATHIVAVGQLTPARGPALAGRSRLAQVVPPSAVVAMTARIEVSTSDPTATHDVTEATAHRRQ